MKKFDILFKKTASFISKNFALSTAISLGFAAVVVWINYIGVKESGMGFFLLPGFTSIACTMIFIFSAVSYKFGPLPFAFSRDTLWRQTKRAKDIEKFRAYSLDRASAALLLELPLGILSIILKFILT